MAIWFLIGVTLLATLTGAASRVEQLSSARWRACLVYVMLFLIPFQLFLPGLPHEATVVTLLGAVLLAVGAFRAVRQGAVLRHTLLVPILFLMIVTACSFLASDRRDVALEWLYYTLWTFVPFFAVAQNLESRLEVKRAARSLVAGGVAVSVFGLAIMITGGVVLQWVDRLGATFALYHAPEPPVLGSSQLYWFNTLYDPSKVNFGTFRNVDYFASFITVLVLLSLSFLLHSSTRRRLSFASLLMLALTSLLLTQGRGALLGCTVGIGVALGCWLMRRSGGSKTFTATILLPIPVIAGVYLLVSGQDTLLRPLQMVPLLESAYSDVNLLAALDTRLYIWSEGWRVFVRRPWVGWGYEVGQFFATSKYGQSHSWYLETLIKSGVLGLAAHLLVIFVAMKHCFNTYFWLSRSSGKTFERALVLGLGCYLISFLVDGVFNDPTRSIQNMILFWSVIGLIAAAGKQRVGTRTSVISRDLNPKAMAFAKLLLFGISISLSIVHLEHYLYMVTAPMSLVMVGVCLPGVTGLFVKRAATVQGGTHW